MSAYTPELLLPAGSLKHMRYAFAYGADAVYAGLPRYSLRVRNNEFNLENLKIGINEAHALGKKFFVTVNIMPHNSKLKTFLKDMQEVIDLKPDALIMADPGLIHWVHQNWPEVEIHLSVQANTVNYASAQFWQEAAGVSRVILSRELSLEEVGDIKKHCPDLELEVFVHGSLCIAYSGRCLLSGYFNHRDPNQGTCTNSCRWSYDVHKAKEDEQSGIVPEKQVVELQGPTGEIRSEESEDVYLIEEANRPGELMPIEEDEHGTYIMNSKDLRAVEHVRDLIEMKIDCLKVEGRTKSHYYVARTAQSYRKAIDDAMAGKEFDPSLIGTLDNLANRGYTDGFFKRHHSQDYQNYMDSHSRNRQQQFCAEALSFEEGIGTFLSKNKIRLGDSLEVVTPEGNYDITVESLISAKGEALEEIKGGGVTFQMPIQNIHPSLGLLARNLADNEEILT